MERIVERRRWKSMATYAAVALLLVANGACATIVSGTKQPVGFSSTPPGARVSVNNQQLGVTPVTLKLARKGTHVVQIAIDGYEPYEMQLSRGFNGWYLGNLVFGGVIGLVVDAADGAIYKLSPSQVSTVLVQQGASAESRNGTLFIAVTLRPNPEWERIGYLKRRGSSPITGI